MAIWLSCLVVATLYLSNVIIFSTSNQIVSYRNCFIEVIQSLALSRSNLWLHPRKLTSEWRKSPFLRGRYLFIHGWFSIIMLVFGESLRSHTSTGTRSAPPGCRKIPGSTFLLVKTSSLKHGRDTASSPNCSLFQLLLLDVLRIKN